MIILETTRLYLKTIEKEDSQILYDTIFSDEETMQYLFPQKTFTLEETKKFIYQNFCKNNANVGMAPLFEKKSGILIGIAGVLKNELLGKDHYELGFIIAEKYRQKGYATEVAQAQIIFAKKVLRQKMVYASVDPKNEISKHILTNLDMHFEKNITLKEKGDREVYAKKL